MKKRVIAMGLALSLSLMTLAGCGFVGGNKADADVKTGNNEVSLKSAPTEEILSADFTEFKFQVDNTVFQLKSKTTVEEFMKQFPADEYTLSKCETSTAEYKDQSLDRLVEAGGVEFYFVTNKKFAASDDITAGATSAFQISIRNKSDSVCELKDCEIANIEFNVVYAGSIYLTKGIPLYDEAIASDERFSYDNIKDTFAGYGAECIDENTYDMLMADSTQFADKLLLVPSNDGLSFNVVTYEDLYTDNMVSPALYWITLTIDPETRMCSNVSFFYQFAVEGLDW